MDKHTPDLLAAEFDVPWVVKAILAGDDNAAPRIGHLAALRAITAALSTPSTDSVREALERIDKFVINFRSPWGSWKTAWWEGEVSDDAALTADNALMHIANIARAAIQSSEADNG